MKRAPAPSGTTTRQLTPEEQRQQAALKLTKKDRRAVAGQVSFSSNTVDNEGLNKKKSKCCCVYVKPTKFGESEEEDDDECANCRGHTKPRRKDGSLRSPPPEGAHGGAGPSTGK